MAPITVLYCTVLYYIITVISWNIKWSEVNKAFVDIRLRRGIIWPPLASYGPLRPNVTSSIKAEIHNVSQRRRRRTEPHPQGICTQNFVKIGPAVFRDMLADRQTDRQTDRNTPLPYRGGVIVRTRAAISCGQRGCWCWPGSVHRLADRETATSQLTAAVQTAALVLSLFRLNVLAPHALYGLRRCRRNVDFDSVMLWDQYFSWTMTLWGYLTACALIIRIDRGVILEPRPTPVHEKPSTLSVTAMPGWGPVQKKSVGWWGVGRSPARSRSRAIWGFEYFCIPNSRFHLRFRALTFWTCQKSVCLLYLQMPRGRIPHYPLIYPRFVTAKRRHAAFQQRWRVYCVRAKFCPWRLTFKHAFVDTAFRRHNISIKFRESMHDRSFNSYGPFCVRALWSLVTLTFLTWPRNSTATYACRSGKFSSENFCLREYTILTLTLKVCAYFWTCWPLPFLICHLSVDSPRLELGHLGLRLVLAGGEVLQ